jgi:hypothetical protein
MKMYKVLNKDMVSPYQDMPYEIGVEYHCKDFDTSEKECSRGYYATTLEGLSYAYRTDKRVFECECWGNEKRFDIYKHRFEYIKLIREVSQDELYELCKPLDKELGYNLSMVIKPVNPLLLPKKRLTQKHKDLLKEWDSVVASIGSFVGDSVWASVWDSIGSFIGSFVGDSVRDSVVASIGSFVGDSVGASVWASVWDSIGSSVWAPVIDSVRAPVGDSVWASVVVPVGDSVGASVWAYISSVFPNITKWEYVDHEEGINPFQSCIDLWNDGFIPSFDGRTWRLHQGKKAEVVYEMEAL